MTTDGELLEQRTTKDTKEAAARFAETTRSSSFSLSFGVHETRLLARNEFGKAYNYTTAEYAAMLRLFNKGLLARDEHEVPYLTEAGELVRRLMVISKHIVLPSESKLPIRGTDLLEQFVHAVRWYGSHGMTAGSNLTARKDRDADGRLVGITVTSDCPDWDVPMQGHGHLRPRRRVEWVIPTDGIRRIG